MNSHNRAIEFLDSALSELKMRGPAHRCQAALYIRLAIPEIQELLSKEIPTSVEDNPPGWSEAALIRQTKAAG